MWKVMASAEAYVNRAYQPDPLILQLFPWLFSLSERQCILAEPDERVVYSSEADLAGDGLVEPAGLTGES